MQGCKYLCYVQMKWQCRRRHGQTETSRHTQQTHALGNGYDFLLQKAGLKSSHVRFQGCADVEFERNGRLAVCPHCFLRPPRTQRSRSSTSSHSAGVDSESALDKIDVLKLPLVSDCPRTKAYSQESVYYFFFLFNVSIKFNQCSRLFAI